MFNQTLSRVVIPTFKMAIMVCCVLLLYGALALGRRMKVTTYLFFPVCGTFLLLELMGAINIMSEFYYYSESLQRNFNFNKIQSKAELREAKRTLATFRPIRCEIAGLYFVDKSCRIVVVSFLINAVINLLITL